MNPDEERSFEEQGVVEHGSIAEVDSGEQITFDLNPEEFDDSKETNYAAIEIPGMSHPKLQYTGGGERPLSFTAYLHHGATEDVLAAIRQLQSWQYAEYSNGRLNNPPPHLLIVIGDTWPDEQWVLRSCNVKRRRFDKSLNCIYAEVDLEFLQFIDESVDAKDVRGA